MLLDVFRKGDVRIDFPFEDAKFRYEKRTAKVYRRFYGEAEVRSCPARTSTTRRSARAS